MHDIVVTILTVILGLGAVILFVLKHLLVSKVFDNGHEPVYRPEAFIEMRSSRLLAFDFTSTSAIYEIPDFTPGYYKIALGAVYIAQEGSGEENAGVIAVQSGAIFLVDASVVEDLLALESLYARERDGCPNLIAHYDKIARKLGLRFDYLSVDNGTYSLDFSQLIGLGKESART